MAKDDTTFYWVSNGRGKIMKVTGWVIREAWGGFAKAAKAGLTMLEDKSGK